MRWSNWPPQKKLPLKSPALLGLMSLNAPEYCRMPLNMPEKTVLNMPGFSMCLIMLDI